MTILSFKALEEADRQGRAHELLDTWEDTKPLLLEKVGRMREAKANGDRSFQCIVVSHNPNSITSVFRYARCVICVRELVHSLQSQDVLTLVDCADKSTTKTRRKVSSCSLIARGLAWSESFPTNTSPIHIR
jgi:hypothetical protein